MSSKYRKGHSYYQWRPNFLKKHHEEFESWLIDQGAEIHTILTRGQVFKFTIGKQEGLLFETMMCNKFYFDLAKKFKRDCLNNKGDMK